MASVNKITDLIAAIKTIYSYYAKDTDIETLVNTWTLLLKEYPDEAVDAAFLICLKICKTPPTPADVIEQLNAMAEATGQSDEQLWSEYVKALQKVEDQLHYVRYPHVGETSATEREKITDIWKSMDEGLRQYIGTKDELMRMARSYTDDDLKFEKTRFLRAMPSIKKRQGYKEFGLLVSEERKMLDGNTGT